MTALLAAKISRRFAFTASLLIASASTVGASDGGAAVPNVAVPPDAGYARLTDAAVIPSFYEAPAPSPTNVQVPTANPNAGVVQAGHVATAGPAMQHGDPNTVELAPGETLVPTPGQKLRVAFQPPPGAPAANAPYGGYPTMGASPFAVASGSAPTPGMSCPCPTCPDRRYVLAEGLYMKRDGDNGFTWSNRVAFDEFDYEPGIRVTTGFIMDCMDGIELSYAGLMSWENENAVIGPLANPLNLLMPRDAATVPAAAVDTFYTAQAQAQTWEAQYHSLELNQRSWGGDVISLLHGVRMVNYQEEFSLLSRNFNNQFGSISVDTENWLVGLQLGIDMYYPVSNRISTGLRGRAGGYINFAESNSQLINNNVPIFNVADNDESIAGLFEFGATTTFQATRNLSFRMGYELWYLTGMATIPGNTPGTISTTFGRHVDTDEEIFFNGVTAGAEVRW